MESDPKKDSYRIAFIAIGFFAFAVVSRSLLLAIPVVDDWYGGLPRLARWSLQPLIWTSIVLAGLAAAHRTPPWRAWRELGLAAPPGRALLISFVASSPMLLGFALISPLNPELSFLGAAFGAGVWPFAEELLYRGYAFHQLHRRAGLNLWAAAILVGFVFGLVHLGNASVQQLPLSGEIGTVALVSIGGVLYAWLFARWDDNLWMPFFLHAFMNLWWDVFDVAESALGGWLANVLRAATVVIVILLTIYRGKIPGLRTDPAASAHRT